MNRRDRESVCQCTDINGGTAGLHADTNLVETGCSCVGSSSGNGGTAGWRVDLDPTGQV